MHAAPTTTPALPKTRVEPPTHKSADPFGRLVVASSCLPVHLSRTGPSAPWEARTTIGGLVTALRAVLTSRGGVWVGWTGATEEKGAPVGGLSTATAGQDAYDLRAVSLTSCEERDFYSGFCNQVLWPLFHGLPDHSLIEPPYWPAYQRVNRKFAEEVAAVHRDDDLVWVHDYQLLLVGEELRRLGVTRGVSFFLHTPFPPPELFFRLPWADRLLTALACYDLVGFQTDRHMANFLACLRRLDSDPVLRSGHPALAVEATVGGEPRRFQVGSFPTGVDFYALSAEAGSDEIDTLSAKLRDRLGDCRMLLGIDRLDYTKGVRHKLKAFANLLETHPEWQGKVVLLQVVIPSRETIPAYAAVKEEIEGLVGEINGRFSRPAWIPIQYHYRRVGETELLALYRTADTAVIVPLEDGMNLVAKEYCAANVDESGVLVLSRFAGAAAQLADGALLVNPWDEVDLAETLHRALTMPPEARREHMVTLRAMVRNEDIFHWAGSFLKAAIRAQQGHPPALSLPISH